MSDGGIRWKWLGAVVGVLVALQFVPMERANPPVESEMPAPSAIKAILERSCYDCSEEVEEGERPLWIDLPLHPSAELSDSDLAARREWAVGSQAGR